MLPANKGVATLSQRHEFDEIIDARSPAEFADDHIPGARNCPVLDDTQRAEIGTLYKQVSPFAARKLGAVYVAQNIATHLLAHFQDRPKSWRPLIYCWRGGQRSGAFTTWLRLIGWDAHQLEGGYKIYRRDVLCAMDTLPAQFEFRVLCGATGSGKTRLLQALREQGAQVLDLESLAAHRGSVLGALPGTSQPTQKMFEGNLIATLRGFDATRTVFIEAESRKIGVLYLPNPLLDAMHRAPCIVLEASDEARLKLLLEDYAALAQDPAGLVQNLQRLAALHSRDTLARWCTWAEAGDLAPLFADLIKLHYDPLYQRSQHGHFTQLGAASRLQANKLGTASMADMARALLVQGL